MTESMQKKLHENHEKYLEDYCDLKELDFEQYRDEGGFEGEAQQRFLKRCVTVQQLDAAGYSRSQLKHLYKLIMDDFDADRIMSMFPKDVTLSHIDNLASNF